MTNFQSSQTFWCRQYKKLKFLLIFFKPFDIEINLSASDNESLSDFVKDPNTLSNNESKSLSELWEEATDEDTYFQELSCIDSGCCLISSARSCTFVNLIGSTTTLAESDILIVLYVGTLRRQNEEIIWLFAEFLFAFDLCAHLVCLYRYTTRLSTTWLLSLLHFVHRSKSEKFQIYFTLYPDCMRHFHTS